MSRCTAAEKASSRIRAITCPTMRESQRRRTQFAPYSMKAESNSAPISSVSRFLAGSSLQLADSDGDDHRRMASNSAIPVKARMTMRPCER